MLLRLQLSSKHPTSSRFLNFLVLSSSLCIIYLIVSVFLFRIPPNSKLSTILPISSSSSSSSSEPTSLRHLVFGIASNAKSWPKRKHFVKLWWPTHSQIRGCVFLDSPPNPPRNSSFAPTAADGARDDALPPVCISGNTSRFRYTYKNGLRSAIRVARVVSKTMALNHFDVRWFVFGAQKHSPIFTHPSSSSALKVDPLFRSEHSTANLEDPISISVNHHV